MKFQRGNVNEKIEGLGEKLKKAKEDAKYFTKEALGVTLLAAVLVGTTVTLFDKYIEHAGYEENPIAITLINQPTLSIDEATVESPKVSEPLLSGNVLSPDYRWFKEVLYEREYNTLFYYVLNPDNTFTCEADVYYYDGRDNISFFYTGSYVLTDQNITLTRDNKIYYLDGDNYACDQVDNPKNNFIYNTIMKDGEVWNFFDDNGKLTFDGCYKFSDKYKIESASALKFNEYIKGAPDETVEVKEEVEEIVGEIKLDDYFLYPVEFEEKTNLDAFTTVKRVVCNPDGTFTMKVENYYTNTDEVYEIYVGGKYFYDPYKNQIRFTQDVDYYDVLNGEVVDKNDGVFVFKGVSSVYNLELTSDGTPLCLEAKDLNSITDFKLYDSKLDSNLELFNCKYMNGIKDTNVRSLKRN